MTLCEGRTTGWRRRETFPDIRAAGKVVVQGDRVQSCLREVTPRPVTPPVVRKLLNSIRPEPGVIRVPFGKANDPDMSSSLVHGVTTRSSVSAGLIIYPPPQTFFQKKLCENHGAVYKKAPLGRSQVNSLGLPHGLDLEETTFGIKTIYTLSAGELINPPKTAEQVEKEVKEEHEHYICSHNSYFVGERINRRYDPGTYREDSMFGMLTPHNNDGLNARRALQWPCDTQRNHSAKLVSKLCDDFRERTQPHVGRVHDPISETLRVPADHTFGVLLRPDEFCAGDLLHATPHSEFQRGRDRSRTLVSAVRQHLKKSNFQNFSSLLEAFRHYDKKDQGKIDKHDLREACRQFNLDLSEDVLHSLMDHCDPDKDGFISFLEFANFLNWKDKMPISEAEQRTLTAERMPSAAPAFSQRPESQEPDAEKQVGESLAKPEDLELAEVGGVLKTPKTLSRTKVEPGRFVTSSSAICAVVGGLPTTGSRTFGVRAVRTDLPPPRIKRITDRTNYGDEATAYDLLFPPLHSVFNVNERDFFSPRTRDEMMQIFRNWNISDQIFEEVWNSASLRHPAGEVCVENFRKVLRELQSY
ncbi:EF-hand domain-containing family member B [Trichomycterus rosablanca]|uniref:EF-hand domain-containing family member B n=1 Tax=Trichomycterus rosablanca TaxID=2290929 RepID=UPI002F3580C7